MDLYRFLSLTGYSMLPIMVLYPLVSLLLPYYPTHLAMAFVAWSTSVCIRLLMPLLGRLAQLDLLIYPCFLALLVIPF
ncbi:hypothetical protein PR202_gb22122 [Eleusine coracana subsp. coracana]|uniref:Uncharacterized protein n=1 Tax=Eleusine coracana subsp. coracana TaxID=191504 RepID=A0AAV5FF57_ELECO|nr:hypothetical protein PR202_gb22122 [Eleusine coracana subsp. coracana]